MRFNFEEHCEKFKDQVAVEAHSYSLTYWDLYQRVEQVAQELSSSKLNPILFRAEDPLSTWIHCLASYMAGLTIVPTDPRLSEDLIESYLKGEGEASQSSREHPWVCIFTSGSSGRPKGVVHSFARLKESAESSLQFYRFEVGDRWLLSLGLHHIGGLMIALRTFLGGGVLCVPRVGEKLHRNLEFQSVDFISLVPTQLQDLLIYKQSLLELKRCKGILIGGAACPAWLWKDALKHGLQISLTYGSSEAGAQLAASKLGVPPLSDAHVGELLPGRDIKIESDGRISIGRYGRFLSYWGYPDIGDYFQSQDRGRIEGHQLFLEGRLDRVFQSGGENISPDEIERLCDSFGQESMCLVIPEKDQRLGACPILILIQKERPDVNLWLEFLNQKLPSFKRPRKIYWDAKIPIEGKVQSKTYQTLEENKTVSLLWEYHA